MWENDTVVLVTSLKKRILGNNDKVHLGRIEADNAIPTFIKTICRKRIEEYIVKESPFSVKTTPHFEIRKEDIENFKTRFLEILREAAYFSQKEIEEILQESLILRLDYLVKPVDTMRRILFEGKKSIQISEMESALNPFTKVLSYADKLIKECHRLGYSSIERDEYTNIVNDIFQLTIEDDPIKIVLHDFSVLTDFISETKGEEVTRVEGIVVQDLLADRNLWRFRRALEIEMKLGKEDFDVVDLEMTLKRYLELKAEFSETVKGQEDVKEEIKEDVKEEIKEDVKEEIKEDVKEEIIDEIKEDVKEEIIDEIKEDTKKEIKKEAQPVLDEIVQEYNKPEIKPKVEESFQETSKEKEDDSWSFEDVLIDETLPLEKDIEKKKPIEEKPKKQMRIIRREPKEDNQIESEEPEEILEKSVSQSQVDGLSNLIDEKTEKVFVKKLFDGDNEAFKVLLNKLDESESWRVAKILIDNELFKRDVDPFSREAIKLVDMVYSRYYPEEGVGGK
jgi:hypothetical protein